MIANRNSLIRSEPTKNGMVHGDMRSCIWKMLGEERVESPDLVYGDPEPGVDGDHLLAGGQETDNLPAACTRIKKVKYLALKTEISVLYSKEILRTLLLGKREVVQNFKKSSEEKIQ